MQDQLHLYSLVPFGSAVVKIKMWTILNHGPAQFLDDRCFDNSNTFVYVSCIISIYKAYTKLANSLMLCTWIFVCISKYLKPYNIYISSVCISEKMWVKSYSLINQHKLSKCKLYLHCLKLTPWTQFPIIPYNSKSHFATQLLVVDT